MKPTFHINKYGAQDKSPTYDTFLTKEILDDISSKLLKSVCYDVEWVKKKNQGRLITLETDYEIYFINLSQTGEVRGRNYQIQSIPTALSIYLNKKKYLNKKCVFMFYFLPFSGNNETEYMIFSYRVMKTAGINFINPDFGLKNTFLRGFSTVRDLINAKNSLRSSNSGNQSTYITDEGEYYHIYGKTFGANQKETTLLCLAIAKITDKPVKLFQILDNNSKSLSDSDKESIVNYCVSQGVDSIEILDESYRFDDDTDEVKDNLRSPRFIYNLLSKFGGEKKCILCGCKIDQIIQAAHIYPVADIRKSNLSLEDKLKLAVDKDNGIWLCENHHKLFDRKLIWFKEGNLQISKNLNKEDLLYIEQFTTTKKIESQYLNERMLGFFDCRDGVPSRVDL